MAQINYYVNAVTVWNPIPQNVGSIMLDLLSAKTCNSYNTYSLSNKAKSTA
jgi:hypothetical protein